MSTDQNPYKRTPQTKTDKEETYGQELIGKLVKVEEKDYTLIIVSNYEFDSES